MQQRTLDLFQKHPENHSAVMQVEEPIKKSHLPWVEKYRPNNINDISHQEEVVKSLRGVLKTGSLPHLLFYGPPGTGKTSAVHALAKQLFGPDFYRKRVLELNASDDRGINIVRKKIKSFAEQMAVKNPNNDFICPGYKIIILDEADSITREAQDALRRIIEDFSSTTRFCIICNYITKISEPLSSRCVKYRFKGIPQDQQVERLMKIAQAEGVSIDISSMQKLYEISGGDLRRSITLLQSTSLLTNKNITHDILFDLSGFLPDTYIEDILYCIKSKQLANLITQKNQIMMDGYNVEQLLYQLSQRLLKEQDIQELQKAKIFEQISICEKQLKEGSSPDISLLNLFAQSQKILM